jgi:hypothetical protein
MSTAFSRQLGVSQGRIAPANSVVRDGSFVFCLGSDTPKQTYSFNLGDGARIEQSCDVTGVHFVRFKVDMRGAAVVPAGMAWLVSWGVDGTVSGSRIITAGRVLHQFDGAIDTSQLMGAHVLKFSLAVVAG